jgi:hypothetical protein
MPHSSIDPKFARCRPLLSGIPTRLHPLYPDPPLAGDSLNKLHTGSVAYALPVSLQKLWNFP